MQWWVAWTVAAMYLARVARYILKWFARFLRAPTSRKNFTRASRVCEGNSQARTAVTSHHPPHVHPRRKPDWVVAEVLRLKALMGNSGCRQVAATFNRMHGKHASVGKTFVAQCIHTHQYALQCLRTDMRRKMPRPVAVNATWAMDLTFCTDANGARHTMLGVLDHGSRLLTCLHRITHKSSWTILGHLCFAIARYGKPKKLRTDNEAMFTSKVFTTFLKRVGLRHQRIQTCAPWQNGRMERLFCTLKPLLKQLVIPNGQALQSTLLEFTLFYNHVRPHQNLQGLTPAEKWQGYSPTDTVQTPPKQCLLVQALQGWCGGYYLRR